MSKSSTQAGLEQFSSGTTTEQVVKTLVVPLQSSERKQRAVDTAIDDYQTVEQHLSNVLVSYPPHRRSAKNSQLYRSAQRAIPDEEQTVGSKVVLAAVGDVVGAYQSWQSQGESGEQPSFGDSDYFAVTNQEITLVENDRGYGLRVNFIPYNAEWFHLKTRPYHRELIDRVVDGDATLGGAEIHRSDDGIQAHLTVKHDVEVYKPGDVQTTVGVDLGENTLFAAAVVANGDVTAVEMESGDEFRHHRDRLDVKRKQLSQKGDLAGVRSCRGDRERYTDQVCHTASQQIVQLASDHAPACIQLEDLTNYRSTADDPIHDWPFAQLQEYIMYKATAAGIPVTKVDPRNTSITCRKCGQATPEFRNGDEFNCRRCGYEVHADVNAAINIAGVETE